MLGSVSGHECPVMIGGVDKPLWLNGCGGDVAKVRGGKTGIRGSLVPYRVISYSNNEGAVLLFYRMLANGHHCD
jgi:hypothetical protein